MLRPGATPIEDAVLRQSRALGTLVAYLVSQSDAAEPSLAGLGSGALGSRGVGQSQWELHVASQPATIASPGASRALPHRAG